MYVRFGGFDGFSTLRTLTTTNNAKRCEPIVSVAPTEDERNGRNECVAQALT